MAKLQAKHLLHINQHKQQKPHQQAILFSCCYPSVNSVCIEVFRALIVVARAELLLLFVNGQQTHSR